MTIAMEYPATAPEMPRLIDHFCAEKTNDISRRIGLMMRDAVVIQRGNGEIIWHNAIASRTLRLTPGELLGRTSYDPRWQTVRLDGSDLPADEHPAMIVLATQEPVEGQILGVRRGDLRQCWLHIDSMPHWVGDELLAITVFTDITDRIEGQRELATLLNGLQASLIQTEFDQTEGIRFAAAYRSVGISDSLGGDFYGAYLNHANQHGFFIGDVCGHGVRSAALSSLARTTLRAMGPLVDDPASMLSRLHALVQSERPDTFLTALVGKLDHTPSKTTLRAVSGGHPLPILIREGVVRRIGTVGSLVGMVPNTTRPVFECELLAGDQVIMHTDGLTDCATPRLDDEGLLLEIPVGLEIEECLAYLNDLAPDLRSECTDDAAILGFEIL